MIRYISYCFYFLLTIFLLSPIVAQIPAEIAFGDWFWSNKRATDVIAKNGLIVRAGPSAKSERIGKLAFRAKVKYLDNDVKILETLYEVKTETKTIPIKGAWRKIEFEGKPAYVNSAFLYHPLHPSRHNPKVNNEFVLLLAGGNCVNNTHDPNKYQWYGYYNSRNQSCRLRETAIDYARSEGEMTDLHVLIEKDEDLKFIIGSENGLGTGEINEWSADGYYNKFDAYKITGIDSVLVDDPFFEITSKKENEKFKPYGVLKYGDLRQDVSLEEYGYINGYRFIGDIDGDNRPDYVISYGEKDGRTILFLSSQRGPGQVAKAVAVYYTAYCC